MLAAMTLGADAVQIGTRNTSGYIDAAPIKPRQPLLEAAEARRQPLVQSMPA